MRLLFEPPIPTKGRDVVQGKEARQEKEEVAVETVPGLTPATEIKVPTPITKPVKKGKERAETKKANKDPALVPIVKIVFPSAFSFSEEHNSSTYYPFSFHGTSLESP
jgi:hypothetical protein